MEPQKHHIFFILLATCFLLLFCSGCDQITPLSTPTISESVTAEATSIPEPDAELEPTNFPPQIVRTIEETTLWSGPDSLFFDEITTIPRNTQVFYLGSYQNFVMVEYGLALYGGYQGYIPKIAVEGMEHIVEKQLSIMEIPGISELEVPITEIPEDLSGLYYSDNWKFPILKDGLVVLELGFSPDGGKASVLDHHPSYGTVTWQQHRIDIEYINGELLITLHNGARARSLNEVFEEIISIDTPSNANHFYLVFTVSTTGLESIKIFDQADQKKVLGTIQIKDYDFSFLEGEIKTIFPGVGIVQDGYGISGFTLKKTIPGGIRYSGEWITFADGTQLQKPTNTLENSAKSIEPLGQIGLGEITSISYSQDGTLLALANTQGDIHIYDTTTYTRIQTIKTGIIVSGRKLSTGVEGECLECGDIALSPDLRSVALVGADGTTGVWSLVDGTPYFINWGSNQGKVPNPGQWYRNDYSITYPSDGSVIGISKRGVPSYLLQTFSGSSLTFTLPNLNTAHIVLSSNDLKTIAGIGMGGRKLKVYQSVDLQEWQEITTINSSIYPVALSPDGHYFLGKDLRLTNINTGKTQINLTFPEKLRGLQRLYESHGVVFPKFSQGSVIMAVFYGYGHRNINWGDYPILWQVEVWDIQAQELVNVLELPPIKSHAFELNPQGTHIAYASLHGSVEIISVVDGSVVASIDLGNACFFPSMQASPDGKYLAAYTINTLNICDSWTGKLIHTIQVPTWAVLSISFSPDGKTIASSGYTPIGLETNDPNYDGIVYLWDVESGELVDQIKSHKGNIRRVLFSKDGKTLIVAGGTFNCWPTLDPSVKFWDTKDKILIKTWNEIPGGAGFVENSWDGEKIAIGPGCKYEGSYKNKNHIYWVDINSDKLNSPIQELDWPPGSLAVSPSGEVITDRYIVYSFSGSLFATLGGYESIDLWQSSTNAHIKNLRGIMNYTNLLFHPDGTMLFGVGDQPGMATIWGIPND